MPKSKSSNVDRNKRATRDPRPERVLELELELESQLERQDGVVVAELDELDTDKYEPAPRKAH
jgi:hypothetical protein